MKKEDIAKELNSLASRINVRRETWFHSSEDERRMFLDVLFNKVISLRNACREKTR